MKEQKLLFEIVKTKVPDNLRLSHIVEDLLGVSADAAYRRMRGETELTFSELVKVCRKFNVSLDDIVYGSSNQGVLFQYSPVSLSDQESYICYLQRLLEKLKDLKSAFEKEIIFVAQVIPYYYLVKYPELAFFKLYVWSNITERSSMTFHHFCRRLEKDRLISIFEQMYQTQMFIPAKEIWNSQTIDTPLRMIEYYFEIGAFESKDTALSLLDQLAQLLETVKRWADDGHKGRERNTPFYQYVCSVDLESAIMLAKREKHLSCTVRINTVDSIATDNALLCSGIQQWMDDLIVKSIQISGISMKERVNFYMSLKNKIADSVKKIKK